MASVGIENVVADELFTVNKLSLSVKAESVYDADLATIVVIDGTPAVV